MSKDENPFPASGSGPVAGATIIGQTMRTQGTLTSMGGKAVADVKAGGVVMTGSAKGSVETARRLVLEAGASLEGDVKPAGIVIEDGAYIKGGVDIIRPPSS